MLNDHRNSTPYKLKSLALFERDRILINAKRRNTEYMLNTVWAFWLVCQNSFQNFLWSVKSTVSVYLPGILHKGML